MLLTDLFTQIADAIREKDGTEERIAAVDFPSRILAISTEGETGEGDVLPLRITCGEFVLTEDITTEYEFYHNGSGIPIISVIYAEGCFDTTADNPIIQKYTTVFGAGIFKADGSIYSNPNAGVILNSGNFGVAYNDIFVNATEEKITIKTRATSYPYRKGISYKWLCVFR